MAAAAARWWAVAAVVAVAAMAGAAKGDFAADKAECADKLMALATCLTYVEEKATARAPTRDCCAGLGQVVAGSKKCLCVLVKDRDEPALGFRINVTRAMDLPSGCSITATFSDCPKMLNMSPDSKEAEIFKQYAREHESNNATKPAPAAAAAATGSAGKATAATGDAGVGRRQRSSLAARAVAAAVLAAVFGLTVA
uniref:Bifunctional inhibitor/plant lipid transfer protein/seed storage helical domain-containing protein n=1 Tax=Oryza meridionalis TaxID=40149 RepID=A0A0E0D8G7_9ORYZ